MFFFSVKRYEDKSKVGGKLVNHFSEEICVTPFLTSETNLNGAPLGATLGLTTMVVRPNVGMEKI